MYMSENIKESSLKQVKESFQQVDNLYNRYSKSIGLSTSAVIVLDFLNSSSEIYTQTQICDTLGFPKQLVNVIIKSFWEKGYVKLQEAKDRRHKEVILTNEGKSYAENIANPLHRAELQAWDALTDEEALQFLSIMKKYEQLIGSAINGAIENLK